MKAYTDLDQSKKLAEILPLESADMRYSPLGGTHPWVLESNLIEKDAVLCWSLAALLKVIPKYINVNNKLRMDIGDHDFEIWYDDISYGCVNESLPDIVMESPIDACVEMILKLHEQNIL